MNRRILTMAVGIVILAAGLSIASAGTEGAVSGTGHVSIKKPPQILRVQMPLSADGKDITEAIAHLKAAQADATKKLTDLAATATSIEFGAMQSGAVLDARQRYMQEMIGRQTRNKKPPAATPSVTLTCSIKAEWPMKEGPQEQLLAAGYALQEKIKAAGIGKSEKKLTPEEQEAAEEAAAMNGGNANVNDPVFLYVSKVSEEDRATAMTDAFKKAKASAALLAKAADAQLGALQKMSSSAASPSANTEGIQELYVRFMMQQAGASVPSDATNEDEATSAAPGPVELQITVTATFDITK